jgi:hypothetical protein
MTYVANAHLAQGLRGLSADLGRQVENLARAVAADWSPLEAARVIEESRILLNLAAARLDEPVVRAQGDEVPDWPPGLPGGAMPGRPAEAAPMGSSPSSARVIAAMREAGFPMVDPAEAYGCPDGVVGCTGGHQEGEHG